MHTNIINKEVIQIDDNQLMIIIMVLNLVTDLIELIITIIKKEGD